MKEILVIAVPGSYSTPRTLKPLVDFLTAKKIPSETICLPWHDTPPKKQKENLQNMTLTGYVNHVEKVIEKHLLQKPHVKIIFIGHSMGTSIIDRIISKSPKKFSGVIYLAPTAGLNFWGLLQGIFRYRSVIMSVALGKVHRPPFCTVKKTMLNATPPGKAGSIYQHFTFESGKVLREVFLFRTNIKKNIPELSIFASKDKTIRIKKGIHTKIVQGDHMSVVNNSKELVLEFIEQITT